MKEETIHISQPQYTKIIPSRAFHVKTKMACRLQKFLYFLVYHLLFTSHLLFAC